VTSATHGRTVPFVLSRGVRPPHASPTLSATALVVAEEPVRIAVHVAHVEIQVAIFLVVEPDRADALSRVGQTELCGDVAEAVSLVPEEHIGTVAKRDEQIQIAIRVRVHPGRLAHGAARNREARRRGGVAEASAIVAIQPQNRIGAGGKPQEQVGIAVGVEVTPRG
jgi:hypothetical protein